MVTAIEHSKWEFAQHKPNAKLVSVALPVYYTVFFYKNMLYKNIDPEIVPFYLIAIKNITK